MAGFDFESTISIRIIDRERGDELFSAILERDPNFLHWSRISLIGSSDDYRRFLPICREQIHWELYENPNWWVGQQCDPLELRTFGMAVTVRTGMAGGSSISRDGIQKFADLEIHKHVEILKISEGKPSAIYTFLQRPPDWFAYPRCQIDALSVRGEWRNVSSLGLRLRLLTKGHRRNDTRVSQEIELIELPGVEIQPIEEMSSEVFVAAAEKLWLSARILMMFRFKQPIATLKAQICVSESIKTTWNRVEIEPRTNPRIIDSIGIFGRVDDFLVEAAPRLGSCQDSSGVLHAATYGYASSFRADALEGQLTQRVEAIERLVAVYEKTVGLDRHRICRAEWSKVKVSLKKAIDDCPIDIEIANHLKRGFASPPPLTLQERIERMVAAYPSQWGRGDLDIIKEINHMIATRNAIVHGRIIENFERLTVEALRAQAIFEKLFMSFVGCNSYHSTSYLQQSISHFERRVEDNNAG